MYFRIKHGDYDNNYVFHEFSVEIIEESENIINEFGIKKLNDSYDNDPKYDYYCFDAKTTRKFKLLSLQDVDIKQKLIKLEVLLYNEKLIQHSEYVNFFGTSGYSGVSGTSGISGVNSDYPAILSIPLSEISETFIEQFRKKIHKVNLFLF